MLSESTVSLTLDDIQEARALSEESYRRYATTSGHYRNTASSHLIGRLGEIGCERWLGASVKCESAFRDSARDKQCDIVVAHERIEVKTWSMEFWRPWGRCVATRQLPAIQRKADIVVWCTIDRLREADCDVTVRGWNRLTEIATLGPTWTGPAGRQVENLQMPESLTHSPLELLSHLLLSQRSPARD